MFRPFSLACGSLARAASIQSSARFSLVRNFSSTRITSVTNFEGIAMNSTNHVSNIHDPSKSSTIDYKIHKYILYCNFTKNNTHLTLVAVTEDLNYFKKNPHLSFNERVLYHYQLPQKVKLTLSTGQLGFRKSARGEYEASFQTSAKVFALMQEKGFLDSPLEIVVKNFGKGREAFIDALKGKEGDMIRGQVNRISDNTKLKFGGTRSPKSRRL